MSWTVTVAVGRMRSQSGCDEETTRERREANRAPGNSHGTFDGRSHTDGHDRRGLCNIDHGKRHERAGDTTSGGDGMDFGQGHANGGDNMDAGNAQQRWAGPGTGIGEVRLTGAWETSHGDVPLVSLRLLPPASRRSLCLEARDV